LKNIKSTKIRASDVNHKIVVRSKNFFDFSIEMVHITGADFCGFFIFFAKKTPHISWNFG
jgi:hypothetical protein